MISGEIFLIGWFFYVFDLYLLYEFYLINRINPILFLPSWRLSGMPWSELVDLLEVMDQAEHLPLAVDLDFAP